MPIRFSIYYDSPENQEYLRQVIDASGNGQLVDSQDLTHLPAQGVNGPMCSFWNIWKTIRNWIIGSKPPAADPRNPAIFLYFKEISTNNLWKALRLGAKECFTFPVQEEDFHNASAHRGPDRVRKAARSSPTQIISFLGCKGGVGTTFLVANVASLLAQERLRASCWS